MVEDQDGKLYTAYKHELEADKQATKKVKLESLLKSPRNDLFAA